MNENGISIKYEPFREIVIMERTRFPTPDKLARFVSIIAGGKLAGLYWVDGIVFLYFPLPASNQIIAKELVEEKKLYWSFNIATAGRARTGLCQTCTYRSRSHRAGESAKSL